MGASPTPEEILKAIKQSGYLMEQEVAIPMRKSRKVQVSVDGFIYAMRNRIERCVNKLKNFRRLATRYDKTADSYLGFVQIAASHLWTRQFVNRT